MRPIFSQFFSRKTLQDNGAKLVVKERSLLQQPQSIQHYFALHNLTSEYPIEVPSSLPLETQQLLQYYTSHQSVRLIMLIGSINSAKNDSRSDIDIVLVCQNRGVPPLAQRLAAIASSSKSAVQMNTVDAHIWSFGISDDFILNGQEVCTQFFTKKFMLERIRHTIDGFYTQIGMEHPLASLASLLNAQVLVDKDKFYPKLIQQLEPYPEKLRQRILQQEQEMRFPYYLKCIDTAIVRQDVIFAHKMIHNALDSILYILFAKYRQFPKGPKRVEQQISLIVDAPTASAITSRYRMVVTLPTTPETLQQKKELLMTIFKLVSTEK